MRFWRIARTSEKILAMPLPTNAAELNNFHEVVQEDVKEFAY